MNRTRLSLSAIVLAFASSLAFAQNADPNSAGPTKNDYRLRVLEPAEGATITGGTVRVVVNTEIPAERDTKRDSNSMPRPRIDVFIDESHKGTMKDENNVISVDAVSPGAHKLVVLAKNMSGEIIDRKEIRFNVVAGTAETTITDRSTSVERPATSVERPATSVERPATSVERPVERPATQVQSAPPPPPPAARPASPPPAPVAVAETRTNELPATGTSDLALGAAGLALLVGGFALRRRA